MRALFMLLAIVAMAIPAAAQQPAAARAGKPAAAKPSKPSATATAPLNLNTATQAQLDALPGIGAKAAERILDYRKKSGIFVPLAPLFCLAVAVLLEQRATRYAAFALLVPQLLIAAYGWQHPRALWPQEDGRNRLISCWGWRL